jgi:hypothetical protein
MGSFLKKLFQQLKLVLKLMKTGEQRPELQKLSGALMEYARMLASYHNSSLSYVIVEVPDLATRFREKPTTIKHALALLEESGNAEHVTAKNCWKIKL